MSPDATPPMSTDARDGRWGWVVVTSSFCVQALVVGNTYSFGVLLVTLLDDYGASKFAASWIGSIQPFFLYFTGISAPVILPILGWRGVTIFGAIISAAGLFASAFAPNIYVLYLTYGVVTGIGNGMMYMTSIIVVQHYFEQKRAIATGISVSGSGVGLIIFGFMLRFLLDNIQLRYTLLVEAATMLVVGTLCGAPLRPLLPPQSRDDDARSLEDSARLTSEHSSPTERRSPDAAALLLPKGMRESRYGSVFASTELSSESLAAESACCAACPDAPRLLSCSRATCDVIRHPVFLIMSAVMMCFVWGYHVPQAFTPLRAQNALGISASKASMLISIMGGANVLSRLVMAYFTGKSDQARFYVGGVALTLGGVVSLATPLFDSFPKLVVYSAVFGACSGTWVSLFAVILVDRLGVDNINASFGFIMAVTSFIFLIAAPISGWITELTHSFDPAFLMVGAVQTLGGLFYFTIACVRVPEPKPQTEEMAERGRRRRRSSFLSL